ncbi:hypothetical protein Pmani_021106 [Petrolisthes manimaculis]|uniref:Transposase Tc1-like domain-containing protein n=1 Tax=Petrolisthes manimaculis TaxID=1843537 RepID=A0AAE1PES4_9EUCA|nr:hypothetical protein Pmani_021106 [Petrolisthes manimaculis]
MVTYHAEDLCVALHTTHRRCRYTDLDVSKRSIRRVLHEAGVHDKTSANKELLTDKHREGRLRFAQQYVDKQEDFWKRVVWTDEKTFSHSCNRRRH